MSCSCCGGNGCDRMFGERFARRSLRRYRRKGLRGDAHLMALWAAENGVEGASVLEVGGGVGAIQAELLRRGAARGAVVEVVATYEPFARELARDMGSEGRSSFVVADLVEQPDAAEPADVVALQRVVCCTPDGVPLLASAAALTRRVLLASYPCHRAWIRAAVRAQNVVFGLLRREFRVYVHDPNALEAAVAARGLRRTRLHRGVVWEVSAFERTQ